MYLLDVCGHGSSAALVASAVCGAITTNRDLMGYEDAGRYYPRDPSDFFSRLSKHFPYEKYESYFTFSYVVVDPKNHNSRIGVAGHPAPYLVGSETVSKVDVIGAILGLDLDSKWASQKIIFKQNDKIIIVSDGVLELTNKSGRFDKVIDSVLVQHSKGDAESLVQGLRHHINEFVDNGEIKDDLTIICVENK